MDIKFPNNSNKHPTDPKKPHNRRLLPSPPSTKKRKLHGHCMDSDTITWSAANRKFSSVEIIHTTHDNGARANLFRVPLQEVTNAELQRRQNAEARARDLVDRLKAVDGKEIFGLMASLRVANGALETTVAKKQTKIDDLQDTADARQTQIVDLQATAAAQQKQIVAQQTQIVDLQATAAAQQTQIDALTARLNALSANFQAKLDDQEEKNKNLESELGLLRGLSPLF